MRRASLSQNELEAIRKETASKVASYKIAQCVFAGMFFIAAALAFVSIYISDSQFLIQGDPYTAQYAASYMEAPQEVDNLRSATVFAACPLMISIIIFAITEKKARLYKVFAESVSNGSAQLYESEIITVRIKGSKGSSRGKDYRPYQDFICCYRDGDKVVESEFLHKCNIRWVNPGAEIIVATCDNFRKVLLREYIRGNISYPKWQGLIVAFSILAAAVLLYIVHGLI